MRIREGLFMTFRKDLGEREKTLKQAEEKEERNLIPLGPFQPWKIFISQLYRGEKWKLGDLQSMCVSVPRSFCLHKKKPGRHPNTFTHKNWSWGQRFYHVWACFVKKWHGVTKILTLRQYYMLFKKQHI